MKKFSQKILIIKSLALSKYIILINYIIFIEISLKLYKIIFSLHLFCILDNIQKEIDKKNIYE